MNRALWRQAKFVAPDRWWQLCDALLEDPHLSSIEKLARIPSGTAGMERVFSCMGWQKEKLFISPQRSQTDNCAQIPHARVKNG